MNSQHQTYTAAEPHLMKIHKLQLNKQMKQNGVVLFIALIALVVMSLAAVALIRSVDTSTIIAGNLASKQSAAVSADSGLETALAWLGRPAAVADPTILEQDSMAQGYYAKQDLDPTKFAWDDNDSRPANDVSGNVDANGKDISGNTIRYVIQRMCRVAGAPALGNCLFGAPVVGTSSQGVRPAPMAGAVTSTDQSPMYRVTIRVTGAKNTISYIQAFVY